MLPLSLVERLSALQCSSLFGVLSLFYLVASVVVHALLAFFAWYTSEHIPSASSDLFDGSTQSVQLLSLSTRSVEAMSIIVFAFTMQVNVPSLYDEMPRRTPARMRTVSSRCMLICFACYALIGIAGYCEWPRSPFGNLLSECAILACPCP